MNLSKVALFHKIYDVPTGGEYICSARVRYKIQL